MNRRFAVFAALVTLVLIAVPAVAQLDRGVITGSVLDPSGAVIPNAEVVLTNAETGLVSRASTNELGLYTLSNIPIGKYELKITAPGFKAYIRSGITLTVAQSLRLDATLNPGQIQESVTVTGEAPLLNVDSAQVSTTIQSRAIQDLPLTIFGGRAMEAFGYALTPGVEGDNWESHIAGSPAFSKDVVIDGISATAHEQGHVGETSPPVEAVQEFTVQTSGLSAEYGHTSGAVFNFALKSGTNELHGSAFYYGRNEALNANTWMNNWRLTQIPESKAVEREPFLRARDRQVLTGASLGGPIVLPKIYNGRNRTFLFGTFEKYSMENFQLSGSYPNTVPIPEYLDGNFSKLLTGQVVGQDALGRDVVGGQIFDPQTLRQVGGKWVADPFAGNIIPANRISKVSKEYIAIYRKSYQPMIAGRLTNNSTGPAVNNPWFHQNQFTFRGDHAFSDRNKLSASFTWSERPRYLGEGLWDPNSLPNGGVFSQLGHQNVNGRQFRMSDNWTITPSMINTFSAAFNRYWNGGDDSKYPGPPAIVQFGSAVNGIDITDIGHGSSSSFYVGNTYVLNDSLAWMTGRHTMKIGFQAWRQQLNSALTPPNEIGMRFSHFTTGLPGAAFADKVGFGFASFLLGEVNEASKSVPLNLYGRRNYVETYFQDDFKVNDRLTLNLGLRWEQAQPFHEKFGRWANFNPDLTNTKLNVKGALEFATPGSSFERNKDWKEFAPRVGAALRLTDKAVLRGGWGVFYVPIGINYWTGVPFGTSPATAAESFRGSNRWAASNARPWFNWDNGYPDNITVPQKDPNFLSWGVVSVDPDSLFQGYNHQYNVSFEYQVSPNLLASAAYMGNVGRRLHSGALKRNQPQRAAYEDPAVDPTAWVSDAGSAAAAGVRYPYAGFSNFAGAALQPFPQIYGETWGPLITVAANLGASRYDSLQLQLTRRMSNGLAGKASYVFSKSRGNVETNFDEIWDVNAGIQDVYDLAREAKTVLSFDRAHVLKGYLQYQLPFGRGRGFLRDAPGWLNAVVGGWDFTWVFRYNTGAPLGIGTNVWYPGWEGAVYADVNGNADLSRKFDTHRFNPGLQNDSVNLFFDRNAFSNPTGHKLGNGARRYEQLRGFGRSNEDIGLLKYWRFKERANLQFRAELLNVFNRHHFADPNTELGNQTNFGYVTGMSGRPEDGPRNVQFGIRLGW